MVPMILYVFLGLINAPTSGWVDWLVIGVMLAYLLPPAVEKSAEMGQNIYNFFSDCCGNTPQIPLIYKGISSYSSWALNSCSYIHAGAMALILTNIFHDIEDTSFDWFFWAFVFPYGLTTFNKYASFFKYGQMIEKAHQVSETDGEKKTRQIFEEAIHKFENEGLRRLSPDDLKALHTTLTHPDTPVCGKLQQMSRVTNSELRSIIPENERIDEFMSSTERRHYSRPWTVRGEVAEQMTNIVFYGSLLGEYYLYQYGIGLFCRNIGLTSPMFISAISNTSAIILSGISFLFESKSVQKFYNTALLRLFSSPDSASNPKLRKGLFIKSFLVSSIISLSEVYRAWRVTLAQDSVAYPLLVFMALRHHARNTYWLRGGYDLVITNWHSRDCGRDKCCCVSCRRGENVEQMINDMSLKAHRLLSYTDQLNAAGVKEVYKAYFGHDPKHN